MNPIFNKLSQQTSDKPPVPFQSTAKGKSLYNFQKEVTDREAPNQSLNHSIVGPNEPPAKKYGFQIFTGKDQSANESNNISKETSLIIWQPSKKSEPKPQEQHSLENSLCLKGVPHAEKFLREPNVEDSLILKGEPYAERFLQRPPNV